MKIKPYHLRSWRVVLALASAGFGIGAWLGVSVTLEPEQESVVDIRPAAILAEDSLYQGTSLSGFYLASRYAESQDELQQAADHMVEVLRREPGDVTLLRNALRVLVAAGRMDKASEIAGRINKAGASDSLAVMLTLTHHVKLGQFDQANALLEKPVSSHGMLEIIRPALKQWVVLGKAPYTGHAIGMQDDLKQAGFMANFMNYQLALMNDMVGEHEMALKYYGEAVDDPQAMPYRLVQALSNYYLRQGNKDKARAVYAQYASQNPASELVPDTIPDIDKDVMAVTPLVENPADGVAELLFTTASLLFGEDVTRESLIYLRLALYLRPDLPPAQLMLANILEQMKNYNSAITVYESIDPQTVFYQRGLVRTALNYEAVGQKDKAIDLLKGQAERDRNDTESLIALGDIHRSDKEFDHAIKAYDLAISRLKKTESDHWGLYYARGICYERIGQWEKAEADLNKALELEADQPDVLNYLGYSWLVRGEHVLKAREYIQQAFEQRPADAHIIDSMGWAHYMIGEFGQSVEYLEQAAELTPHDATINEHLGDAYWRVGRQIEAQFQWKRALQFEPEDPKALQAKLDAGLPPFEPVMKQASKPNGPAPVAAAHGVVRRDMKTD